MERKQDPDAGEDLSETVSIGPAFEFVAENILHLSPICTKSSGEFCSLWEGCKCPSSSTIHHEPDITPKSPKITPAVRRKDRQTDKASNKHTANQAVACKVSITLTLDQSSRSSRVVRFEDEVEEEQSPVKPAMRRNIKTISRNRTGRTYRPLVLEREEDWEREKNKYLMSVMSHMKENTGTDLAELTELQNLITRVTEQEQGAFGGRRWQHPADLTRRNYQKKFGNMIPTISLTEWQAQNGKNFKRFAIS